jgi:RNA polymerase sigma factor (TIGR02999 family)
MPIESDAGAAAIPGGRGEITRLLERWGGGDRSAIDELAPLVYDELKKIARSSLRRGSGNVTLQPTALVHELFLKLLGRSPAELRDRHHFFALSAKVLRRMVVDLAREKGAQKRGGGAVRVDLTGACLAGSAAGAAPAAVAARAATDELVEVLALHHALERLAERDPELERLVELRYFAGLTIDEAAVALQRSPASIGRDWEVARAFLFRELGGGAAR